MEQREKIKAKIKALLSKTVDNGATEAEAIAALKKANQLMLEYYIEKYELKDPVIGEKCVSESVPLIKSGYNLSLFYGNLCQLFDCFHFYNNRRITFFGYDQDAKLCVFFYTLISKACLNEKNKFLKSDKYIELKRYYNGRTLAASFIKGFQIGICTKIDEMYRNRHSTIPEGMGLMLITKQEKVKDQFDSLFNNIRKIPQRKLTGEKEAFVSGQKRGDEFQITQGIEQYQEETTLQLS